MLFARIYRKISFREGVVHYIQDSRAHFFILPHQLESPGKFCVQRRERERERARERERDLPAFILEQKSSHPLGGE